MLLSIRKENGVFVCQECGTEYTVEEAKKLLQDVEGQLNEVSKRVTKSDYSIDANALRDQLLLWGKITNSIDSFNELISGIETTNPSFWDNEKFHDFLSIIPKGRMYGPTDGDWNPEAVDGINNYKLVISNFINRRTKELNDRLNIYEKGTLKERDPKYYNELVGEINSAKSYLNNLLSDFDFEISRNFWNAEFDRLIKEKFCFKEINDVTVHDQKNYIGYNMINESYCANHVDTNNIDKDNYIDFLCRFHYFFNSTNRPVYTVKKMLGTKYIEVFPNYDYLQFYNKVHNELINIHKKHDLFYKNVILNAYKDSKNAILQYITESKELEKCFFLPYEYRKTSYIVTLIELLETGKASSWKELSNLFDTSQYRNKVIGSLEVINNKLSNIEMNLKRTNSLLTSIDNNLNKIDQRLESISQSSRELLNNVNKIRKTSFITMWNTL